MLTDDKDIDRAVKIRATAQRMASDGLTETRRAVHALRADARPLDEELRRVTSVHGERYGVKMTFGVGGGVRPQPPDATIALLRTARRRMRRRARPRVRGVHGVRAAAYRHCRRSGQRP